MCAICIASKHNRIWSVGACVVEDQHPLISSELLQHTSKTDGTNATQQVLKRRKFAIREAPDFDKMQRCTDDGCSDAARDGGATRNFSDSKHSSSDTLQVCDPFVRSAPATGATNLTFDCCSKASCSLGQSIRSGSNSAARCTTRTRSCCISSRVVRRGS